MAQAGHRFQQVVVVLADVALCQLTTFVVVVVVVAVQIVERRSIIFTSCELL